MPSALVSLSLGTNAGRCEYHTELSIRHVMRAVGRGHLSAVAYGKGALGFAIERHALHPSGVVADRSHVVCRHRDLIRLESTCSTRA
jgi:hypothetical protein